MTDREKVAIEIEDALSGNLAKAGHVYRMSLNGLKDKALKDALALVKEQEAKQVIRKQCKKEYDDGSIEVFAEWYCPHCNSLILRGFDNPSIKFCYKCGKPLLWEGR